MNLEFIQLENINNQNSKNNQISPDFARKFRLTSTFLALRENTPLHEIKSTFPREFSVKLPEPKKKIQPSFSHRKLEREFCEAILKRREELLGKL